MLKISLYQDYNVPLCRHIKTQNYRTYQSNTIYGQSKYSINAEDNTDIGTLISGMVSLMEKKASLNGNISSIIWRDSTQTASRGYRFTYDQMNRLTDAVYGEGPSLSDNTDRYSERGMTYTKNGALTRLLRYGRRNTDDFGFVDSLVMTLDGNRVLSVEDGAGRLVYENSFDFKGSVRLVVFADGQVIERNDYYPSGCLITENIDGETVILPYKYNGKEFDHYLGLDLYDYGARLYDPALVVWTGVDPLADEYGGISPYVYCGDNPVNAIDPDGKKVIPIRFIGSGEVTYYRSPLQFQKAMIAFGKTSFGRQILADFTPKDKYIYGVRGNGKYADYNLVIEEIDYIDNMKQFLHFNKNPYNTINATTEMLNVDGKPAFYVQFNVQRTQEELTETVSHEFTVHLSDYNDIIKAYEKEMRYSDAKRLWNSVPESKQHNDMVNINIRERIIITKRQKN